MDELPENLLELAKYDYLVGRFFDKDIKNGDDILKINNTADILSFIEWIQSNS